MSIVVPFFLVAPVMLVPLGLRLFVLRGPGLRGELPLGQVLAPPSVPDHPAGHGHRGSFCDDVCIIRPARHTIKVRTMTTPSRSRAEARLPRAVRPPAGD